MFNHFRYNIKIEAEQLQTLVHRVTAFIKAQNGNAILIFALALSGMAGLIVFSFGFDMSQKADLKASQSADAVVLYLAREAVKASESGDPINGDSLNMLALDVFQAQDQGQFNFDLEDYEINYTVSDGIHTVTMDYEILVNGLVKGTQLIPGTTTASVGQTTKHAYLDLHLMLDYSASMSTGATEDDMLKMYKDSKFQHEETTCAFACHVSKLNYARSMGIALRLDALNDAIDALVHHAQSYQEALSVDNLTQFSAHHFNQTSSTKFSGITDFDELKSETTALRTFYPGDIGTNFTQSFKDLDKELEISGTGSSEDDRQTVIMLITDGITRAGNRSIKTAMHWNDCRSWKDKGAIVVAIYTKYENIYEVCLRQSEHSCADVGADWYNAAQQGPLYVPNALKKCATSEEYYASTDNPEALEAAIKNLFDKAVSTTSETVRLTH